MDMFFCDGGYEKCFLSMTVYHEDKMIEIDHVFSLFKKDLKNSKTFKLLRLLFGFFIVINQGSQTLDPPDAFVRPANIPKTDEDNKF
jgi:hypothetical protein